MPLRTRQTSRNKTLCHLRGEKTPHLFWFLIVILFLAETHQDRKTKQQCRTRHRVQSYYGFTLCQRCVRTTSPFPTTTRRTRCFQVGDYAKIPPSMTKRCCRPGRLTCECGKVYIGETGRTMQDRIKEHDQDIRFTRTETSAISEHAHNTGHKPLWNEVKFIDCDPHYYTRRVKEAIHIRLHPDNINRDSGIKIPEVWMPTIKKHNNRGAVRQRTAKGANH